MSSPLSGIPSAGPELSIVIPAWNEALRLPRSLQIIGEYLRRKGISAEIIVVNDGSTDATAALARQAARELPVRVLDNPVNRGKGYSVRRGMLAARGRTWLFTDADLSAPIEEVEKLLSALRAGADVVIGSRSRKELILSHQSRWRELAGRTFNRLVFLILGLRFEDTQCGFKLFRREAGAWIFARQRVTGWGFDPELLFLARLRGFNVAEIPVAWSHAEGAKIRMVRDSAHMFTEILAIRWHALRGRYHQPPAVFAESASEPSAVSASAPPRG